MREGLESGKTATPRRWARREQRITLARAEPTGIADNVQGLAKQGLPELEPRPPDGAGEG